MCLRIAYFQNTWPDTVRYCSQFHVNSHKYWWHIFNAFCKRPFVWPLRNCNLILTKDLHLSVWWQKYFPDIKNFRHLNECSFIRIFVYKVLCEFFVYCKCWLCCLHFSKRECHKTNVWKRLVNSISSFSIWQNTCKDSKNLYITHSPCEEHSYTLDSGYIIGIML